MLSSTYRIAAYIGIALTVGFFVCEALLTTDHSGINLNLGFAINMLVIVFHILLLVFFILPLYYIRSKSKKIFIGILVIGAIAIIGPATSAWNTIKDWLYPPKELWPFFTLFDISEFRKKINNIEHLILGLMFVCQLLILFLTFKIKKQTSITDQINVHP